jgi:uncharacterized integral membrane protein (TIGR00697 family)
MKKLLEHIHNLLSKLNMDKVQATVILCGLYLFFSFAGNIAATKVTYFGKLITDAGFIYYLTFTWRDLIHKQLGRKAALTTIYLAGIINLLAALYFQWVVGLPAETSWQAAGGQSAWVFLFGLQFRIVLASILAQIISEIVDTKTYQVWTDRFGKNKPQWLRVVVSNSISIPIDSILFPIIAFAGIVNGIAIWQMFLTNLALKAIMTALSWWMIYLVPEKPIYSKN